MLASASGGSVRTTLPPGTRIGRYVIVDRIGAGGMAELFLARQDGPRGFAKPIALKLLHPHLAEDPEFVAMLEREARVSAGLVHRNIVQVLDVGVAGTDHFLALEFVHGRDLRRVITARRGPLPLGCAVRVVIEIAGALKYVHTRCDAQGRSLDLVHRDVSPANVLVGYDGSVKLADFGIAKAADQTAHTRTGMLKGKFGYMAPEQYLQQTATARSDLFALGVLLYEASTGRRAFGAAQTFSIMNRVLAGDYAPPASILVDYPPELSALLARLLAVDPQARPSDAQAVIDELEAFVAHSGLDARGDALAAFVSGLFGHPTVPSLDTPELVASSSSVTALPATSSVSSVRPRTRLPRMIALVAIGVMGIGVGGIGGWRLANGDEREADAASEATAADPAPVASPIATTVLAPVAAEPAAAEPAPRVATVPSEPAPSEPAAVPTTADKPAAAEASPVKKKPRRRGATRGRAPASTQTDTRAGLGDMFPKAMQ